MIILRRALLINTVVFVTIAVSWMIMDYFYVKGGPTPHDAMTESSRVIVGGVPASFFFSTLWALRPMKLPKRLAYSFFGAALGFVVSYLALVAVGIPYHLSIGGRL